MDDLAAWLTQIWDEEQAITEQASPGPWHLNAEAQGEVWAVDDIEVCTAFALSNNQLRWTAAHIARQDPAAILARIAADRQILALHGMTRIGWNKGWVDPTMHQREYCAICDHGRDDDSAYPSQSSYPCQTVRLLALPYADRPGYQEAWKPE